MYESGAHGAHGPPSLPKYPGRQRHIVSSALPTTDSEFCVHTSHATEPGASLNVPATHSTQAVPSAPVAPALHLQSVSSADAGAEFEFGGHAWHVGLPLADHVPRTHGRQVSASGARATPKKRTADGP